MCALAHNLEEKGFATVALAGVRAQAERTRPPRALWTAAPLGRPVGEPDDPGFQLRVLRHALSLLERTDGPVILDDFPDDPPGLVDTPGWTPPAETKAAVLDGSEPGAPRLPRNWRQCCRSGGRRRRGSAEHRSV